MLLRVWNQLCSDAGEKATQNICNQSQLQFRQRAVMRWHCKHKDLSSDLHQHQKPHVPVWAVVSVQGDGDSRILGLYRVPCTVCRVPCAVCRCGLQWPFWETETGGFWGSLHAPVWAVMAVLRDGDSMILGLTAQSFSWTDELQVLKEALSRRLRWRVMEIDSQYWPLIPT